MNWSGAIEGQDPLGRAAFPKTLSDSLSTAAACERAKVSKLVWYQRRNEDPEFERECVEAIDPGGDRLKDEAYRGAAHGAPQAPC